MKRWQVKFKPSPPERTTLKKPSLIRVKTIKNAVYKKQIFIKRETKMIKLLDVKNLLVENLLHLT